MSLYVVNFWKTTHLEAINIFPIRIAQTFVLLEFHTGSSTLK